MTIWKHEKSIQVDDRFEREGVENGDQIKKADVIVKGIGQRDEKIFFFGNLEEKGDGQKEGQDDDATQHQAFYAFQPLWIRSHGRRGSCEFILFCLGHPNREERED